MSAECGKCGFDIVYPPGTWPLGECLNCEQADRIADLEEQLEASRRELEEMPALWQSVKNSERRAVAAEERVAELESELAQWTQSIATEALKARVAELETALRGYWHAESLSVWEDEARRALAGGPIRLAPNPASRSIDE